MAGASKDSSFWKNKAKTTEHQEESHATLQGSVYKQKKLHNSTVNAIWYVEISKCFMNKLRNFVYQFFLLKIPRLIFDEKFSQK